MSEKLIETYIKLLVERQIKLAHLSGNRVSEWGSEEHIADLESRCADAVYWRDKYPKGSEKRSHYRNIYAQLKKELHSAKKKHLTQY